MCLPMVCEQFFVIPKDVYLGSGFISGVQFGQELSFLDLIEIKMCFNANIFSGFHFTKMICLTFFQLKHSFAKKNPNTITKICGK